MQQNESKKSKLQMAEFSGYHHSPTAKPGEWYAMCNLSERFAPYLSVRPARQRLVRLKNARGVEDVLYKNDKYLYAGTDGIFQRGAFRPIHRAPSGAVYRFTQMGNRILCFNGNARETGYLVPSSDTVTGADWRFVPFLRYAVVAGAKDAQGAYISPAYYRLFSVSPGVYKSEIYSEQGEVLKTVEGIDGGEYDAQCEDFLNIGFRYCVEHEDGSLQILRLAHLCTPAEVQAFTTSQYYIASDKKLYRYESESGASIEVSMPKIAMFLRTGIGSDLMKNALPTDCEAGDVVHVDIGRSINLSLPYTWQESEVGFAYRSQGGFQAHLKVLQYERLPSAQSPAWCTEQGWDCCYVFDYDEKMLEWIVGANLIHDTEHYARPVEQNSTSGLSGFRFESTLEENAEGAASAGESTQVFANSLQLSAVGTEKYYPAYISIMANLPAQPAVFLQSNNRLWCADNAANELRASALGNFKNWSDFSELTSDSYTANIGSDGAFCAACLLGENLYFFKEHSYTVLYGTKPSNYCTNTVADFIGIRAEDAQSLQVIDNQAYFMGIDGGIYRFDGTRCVCISEAFGDERYSCLCAAHSNKRYYLLLEKEGETSIFIYNSATGQWFVEDADGVRALCNLRGRACALRESERLRDSGTASVNTDILMLEQWNVPQKDKNTVEWFCESGLIGLMQDRYLCITKLGICFESECGAHFEVLIAYDGEKEYHSLFSSTGHKKGHESIAIPLARCAFFRLKLQGRGMSRIYKISWSIEQGGEK